MLRCVTRIVISPIKCHELLTAEHERTQQWVLIHSFIIHLFLQRVRIARNAERCTS